MTRRLLDVNWRWLAADGKRRRRRQATSVAKQQSGRGSSVAKQQRRASRRDLEVAVSGKRVDNEASDSSCSEPDTFVDDTGELAVNLTPLRVR